MSDAPEQRRNRVGPDGQLTRPSRGRSRIICQFLSRWPSPDPMATGAAHRAVLPRRGDRTRRRVTGLDLFAWSRSGYHWRRHRFEPGSGAGQTPRATVATLVYGYLPLLYPSARHRREVTA